MRVTTRLSYIGVIKYQATYFRSASRGRKISRKVISTPTDLVKTAFQKSQMYYYPRPPEPLKKDDIWSQAGCPKITTRSQRSINRPEQQAHTTRVRYDK